MLVLSRKKGERIVIDGGITVTVRDVRRSVVRLGIDAPPTVPVLRSELIARDGIAPSRRAMWKA